VPKISRFLGHVEAAPSASVGQIALQGRVLEGACSYDSVFENNCKT